MTPMQAAVARIENNLNEVYNALCGDGITSPFRTVLFADGTDLVNDGLPDLMTCLQSLPPPDPSARPTVMAIRSYLPQLY